MRKTLIALVLCLLMVGLLASPAFAATKKVTFIHTGDLRPNATGYATFTTNQGDNGLVVNITLKGALPNIPYYVFLGYHSQDRTQYGHFDPRQLTTNSKGNWGGQDQQYSFEYLLPKGTFYVNLSVIDSTDPEFPSDGFEIPLDTTMIRITGN